LLYPPISDKGKSELTASITLPLSCASILTNSLISVAGKRFLINLAASAAPVAISVAYLSGVISGGPFSHGFVGFKWPVKVVKGLTWDFRRY